MPFFLGMQALGVQIDPAGTLSINKKTRDKSKETNKKTDDQIGRGLALC